MNDRTALETSMPAPFVSSVMRVEPGWIDHNGHLNMAYYNVLFDRAVDEVYEPLGLGLDYVKTAKCSTFTAEVHVRYLRELLVDTPVRVSFHLLGFDEKRMHYFEALHHAERRLAVGNVREHGAQCRYEDEEGRRVSRPRHGAARTHESGARQTAGPGRRRPAHRNARERLNRTGSC